MENSAENKKNSKKKIVKKRNDIDEEYNELKKKKDTLDEIADEISSKPEKQSLNETEKNEIESSN